MWVNSIYNIVKQFTRKSLNWVVRFVLVLYMNGFWLPRKPETTSSSFYEASCAKRSRQNRLQCSVSKLYGDERQKGLILINDAKCLMSANNKDATGEENWIKVIDTVFHICYTDAPWPYVRRLLWWKLYIHRNSTVIPIAIVYKSHFSLFIKYWRVCW